MSLIDALGYTASAMVLATFCMTSMLPLRLLAIGSNLLFISFGALAHIYPVLTLHLLLLPVNLARLAENQPRIRWHQVVDRMLRLPRRIRMSNVTQSRRARAGAAPRARANIPRPT